MNIKEEKRKELNSSLKLLQIFLPLLFYKEIRINKKI